MKSLPMSELSSTTSGHQNCCWCIICSSFSHVNHTINVEVPGFHGSQTLCPIWIHNFRRFTYISRHCFTWLLLSPHLTPIPLQSRHYCHHNFTAEESRLTSHDLTLHNIKWKAQMHAQVSSSRIRTPNHYTCLQGCNVLRHHAWEESHLGNNYNTLWWEQG